MYKKRCYLSFLCVLDQGGIQPLIITDRLVRHRLENQRKNMVWYVGVWRGLEKLQKEEDVMKLICGTNKSCTALLDKINEKIKDEGGRRNKCCDSAP